MPYERSRTFTNTTGTVPEGTAMAGTVEGVTLGGRFYFRYTPNVAPPNAETLFDYINNFTQQRFWIWVPTDYVLARVLSVDSDFLVEVDRDVSAVAAGSSAQYVFSDLKAATFVNVGAAAGQINDASFSAGSSRDIDVSTKENNQKFMDAFKLDATGTTIEILEQS